MSIWAPVVAALGASLLTGGSSVGGIWWRERRRDRAAATAEKAEAYHQMIARSLSFAVRAATLRTVLGTRSGLREGLDVAMRLRCPCDPMELHDWLDQDFGPINDAWSKIQMVGSAEAVRAATGLLDACADVLGAGTTLGEARGKLATAVKGLEWTSEQRAAFETATRRVAKDREAFLRVARRELGKEAVDLPVQLTE